MSSIYGAPPVDLGLIDITSNEMMFWLYCPVKLPEQGQFTVPQNIQQFRPILEECAHSVLTQDGFSKYLDSYFYLTAKTLFVTADNPGNRPGWHSDGFMTDDLNFVWSDCNGTLFWEPEERVSFVQDHMASLADMEAAASIGPLVTYPDKHLLRLDQSVIHRVADVTQSRVRTFVKVSVSKDKYDLVGNSVNHELAPDWHYYARNEERNAPSAEETKAEAA